VLVTGGSGFIGGRLERSLRERGARVHAVSRVPRADTGTRWHQADLADPDAADALLRAIEPEVVYHLAGHVTGSREAAEVLPTFTGNLASTVNVLLAATRSRCPRVVLAGSMEELGGAAGIPGSGYAAAKVAATAYARMFHATHGLSVVNLRVFMVYGPGEQDGQRLVPYAVTSLLAGEPPRLSSGTRPVDWVYVGDVVEAFLAAGEAASGDDGEPIDIGSGTLVTIRELVDALAHRIDTGAAPVYGARADRPHEAAVAADLGAARRHLGWQPATPLAAGLDATIAWYRAGQR
jgi:nucleoside-diphosphate-sugar epimerase